MPSREDYFGDESPPYDDEAYSDTEEEVVVTTRGRVHASVPGVMPNYPDTDIGDELGRLYRLYGFDTSRRYEHSTTDHRRTGDMVNEVYPPSQIGDNIYISKSVTVNHCFEETTLG